MEACIAGCYTPTTIIVAAMQMGQVKRCIIRAFESIPIEFKRLMSEVVPFYPGL